MRRRGLFVTAALAGVFLQLGSSAASSNRSVHARWVFTELGTLGGDVSQAVALNDRGEIVGSSDVRTTDGGYSRRHAFLWANGKMRDLGTVGRYLGGDMPNTSEAVAINENDQIIGNSSVNQNEPVSYAFLSRNGRMTAITTKGGPSRPRNPRWTNDPGRGGRTES